MQQIKKLCVAILMLLLVFSSSSAGVTFASSGNLLLTKDLMNDYSKSDVHFNSWGKDSFKDTSENIITNGIGFYPYYSSTERMFSEFYIGDYSYTTLETTISLDAKWKTGDLGKTGVSIYADDKEIYSKTFTNTTSLQNLKLPIPQGTKNVTFFVALDKGLQGNHGVIFGKPTLTNTLPATSAFKGLSLSTIGQADYSKSDVYSGAWNSSAFQTSDGNVITNGYGFYPYYSSTQRMFSKFYVGDYSYTTLETTISIDSKWKTGNLGKTGVSIYADDKEIYTKTFTNSTSLEKLKLPIPQGTKNITFYVAQDKGSQGNHGVIFSNSTLTNELPQASKFNGVALSTIGQADYSKSDVHSGAWNSSAFQMSDGNVITTGYGFYPYYSSTNKMFSKFYIGDYNYDTLKTAVSLDTKWKIGDLGASTLSIFADDALIYSKQLNNKSGMEDILITIPSGTNYLKFQVDMAKGKDGNHGVIIKDPLLVSAKDVTNFKDVSTRYQDAVDYVVSKGNSGFSPTTFGTNNNIKRVALLSCSYGFLALISNQLQQLDLQMFQRVL